MVLRWIWKLVSRYSHVWNTIENVKKSCLNNSVINSIFNVKKNIDFSHYCNLVWFLIYLFLWNLGRYKQNMTWRHNRLLFSHCENNSLWRPSFTSCITTENPSFPQKQEGYINDIQTDIYIIEYNNNTSIIQRFILYHTLEPTG